MRWTYQIAYHQPSHTGFAVKITDSPNMVCMVNHPKKDLQHTILDFSTYWLLDCLMKMEKVREREERLRQQREQYRARRETKLHLLDKMSC